MPVMEDMVATVAVTKRWRYRSDRGRPQPYRPMRGPAVPGADITDSHQQHAILRFAVLTRLIFVDVEQKLSGKEIRCGLNCECPE
jgi:hypothetical protein